VHVDVAVGQRLAILPGGPQRGRGLPLADPLVRLEPLYGLLVRQLEQVVDEPLEAVAGPAGPPAVRQGPLVGGRRTAGAAGDGLGPDDVVELEVLAQDVVGDLAAGVAVQGLDALVADVDVVAAAAGEDDGVLVEPEVGLQEVQKPR